MSKPNSSIIVAALQSGKEMKMSQRDYLVIQQYCENKGIEIEVVKKEGLELTVKMKSNS
jgi:hypothetical protein